MCFPKRKGASGPGKPRPRIMAPGPVGPGLGLGWRAGAAGAGRGGSRVGRVLAPGMRMDARNVAVGSCAPDLIHPQPWNLNANRSLRVRRIREVRVSWGPGIDETAGPAASVATTQAELAARCGGH
jgi:hypothetical protein